jgi:hypothetical protein
VLLHLPFYLQRRAPVLEPWFSPLVFFYVFHHFTIDSDAVSTETGSKPWFLQCFAAVFTLF